ncbi:hypothetical protein RJ640_024049 [Escallonia rubra]|uniref:Retrotransposon gag domain-containing protein n=1 Tax=Escallonia rubra TaxID=112253 RepID=A0AA88RPP7_9ASTE|nr:hypothetical protein RJ640_024049 [Escallonia rubra]
MESDFMRIAQHPNETITEYEERFARLSRFALHVVQDESHRAHKFREGLRFKIRRQMFILNNPTYAQLVDGAQRLERIHDEQLLIWEDKRKKRDRNEENSGSGMKPASDFKRRSLGAAADKINSEVATVTANRAIDGRRERGDGSGQRREVASIRIAKEQQQIRSAARSRR